MVYLKQRPVTLSDNVLIIYRKPEKYGEFLKSMFDAWYLDMRSGTYVYNRYFENLMMIMAGQQPESCNMRGVCGKQWVFEADGSVYPCDFYARMLFP